MQITIVQAEMEAAIKDYITKLVQVREGMVIDIDLRATRGIEGFQAIIDIRPDTDIDPITASEDPAEESEKAAKPSPEKDAGPLNIVEKVSTGRGRSQAKAAAQPVKVSPVIEDTVDAEPVAEPEAAPDVEPEAETGSIVDELPATETETPAPKKLSLFAGAKKTDEADNPEADAAVAAATATTSIFGNLKRPVNKS